MRELRKARRSIRRFSNFFLISSCISCTFGWVMMSLTNQPSQSEVSASKFMVPPHMLRVDMCFPRIEIYCFTSDYPRYLFVNSHLDQLNFTNMRILRLNCPNSEGTT
jgi:hypothetical protein